ncbi:acyl-CoA N-acyltransferase [Aspergillus ellipticus CBS 707.79]|uniref:Acyl-CoA N-acyltransferase n=1 Tax=Aspergillus ellipticus CBS 707.79 TaxID=1448320 RepID=A0A319D270_9EURO|nr:acyl-CoA N-acyltransferase [Aspergillus ellipticus CBS 707.79]
MLAVQPCNPEDAPTLATIHQECFTAPIEQRLWPPVPEMHAWWSTVFVQKMRSPKSRLMKVVDTEKGDAIVGFLDWKVPATPVPSSAGGDGVNGEKKEEKDEEEEEFPPFPPCVDGAMFGALMDDLHAKEAAIMASRPFWYLNILATKPSYRRQGVASKLVEWGVQQADAAGVEMFVVSSTMARGVYLKHGFEMVVEGEGLDGFVPWFMLRKITKGSS